MDEVVLTWYRPPKVTILLSVTDFCGSNPPAADLYNIIALGTNIVHQVIFISQDSCLPDQIPINLADKIYGMMSLQKIIVLITGESFIAVNEEKLIKFQVQIRALALRRQRISSCLLTDTILYLAVGMPLEEKQLSRALGCCQSGERLASSSSM